MKKSNIPLGFPLFPPNGTIFPWLFQMPLVNPQMRGKVMKWPINCEVHIYLRKGDYIVVEIAHMIAYYSRLHRTQGFPIFYFLSNVHSVSVLLIPNQWNAFIC